MSVSIGVRFPLGTYRATPWDRAANSGEVEWPPSPWRILRALIATWHTRCPEIPAESVSTIVTALASTLPDFSLPRSSSSSTRHYLPQSDYRTGGGNTTLTVDGQLSVDPDEELIITWSGVELDDVTRGHLTALVTALPYLGRAESACEARVLVAPPERSSRAYAHPTDPTQSPDPHAEDVSVLVPDEAVTVGDLEATTDQMRKRGRATPVGARWVTYRRVTPSVAPRLGGDIDPGRLTMMRWGLIPPHPIRAETGILQTEALRMAVLGRLKRLSGRSGIDYDPLLRGHHLDEAEQHQHAHWLYKPVLQDGRLVVQELMLWVPGGMSLQTASEVMQVSALLPKAEGAGDAGSDQRAGGSRGRKHSPKAYVSAGLELIDMTREPDPEFGGLSRSWVSVTPVTTRRFPKGQRARAEFWERMIYRELELRCLPTDGVTVEVLADTVQQISLGEDHHPQSWRRYRWKENMRAARHAACIRLTFPEAVRGPLVLGDLAHFGLGLFKPSQD